MKKEELIAQNKILTEQIEEINEECSKLKSKIAKLEALEEINLNLQIENAKIKEEIERYNTSNMILQQKIQTYEKVFGILEKVKGD